MRHRIFVQQKLAAKEKKLKITRLVFVDVKKENLFKCKKIKQNIQWRVWKLKEKQEKNLRTR